MKRELGLAALAVSAGGVAWWLGAAPVANALWAATTVVALVPTTYLVVRDALRRRAGVDVVAVMALGGSLAVREYVAGAVIALMLATGHALEAQASARAHRELRELLHRAPHVVHRLEGERITSPSLDSVVPGDLLLVGAGETVPVDGQVAGASAVLDESALTGEAAVVERSEGEAVRSGSVNAGAPFRLRATATAADSTYANIVRLVAEAEALHAPLVRAADRFALWFVPLTVAMALAAALVAHDAVRGVAVLVVATLCPLILAAPIALVAGMSRCAARGVVVKNGASLEALGRAEVLLLDKTGTLTAGRARVAGVEAAAGWTAAEVLRLAASVDQVSSHPLAAPIVRAALERGLRLDLPGGSDEVAGRGVRGVVGGRAVAVGRASFVTGGGAIPAWARAVRRRTAYEGMANVFVSVDGAMVGALVLEDPIRPDAARTLQRLRAAGIRRVVMVTGDHHDVAESVASALGIDDNGTVAAAVCPQIGMDPGVVLSGAGIEALDDAGLASAIPSTTVFARVSPDQKSRIIKVARSGGRDVAFLGDGVNDAVALHHADVGISVDSAADVAKDAADIVLLDKDLDVLADGVVEGRRIFANTVKYVLMATSSNFGNMFSAAAASVFLSFLPMLPSQILLNNLLYDAGQMAIPTDRVDAETLARPAAWDLRFVRRFMIVFGPVSSDFDFLTFYVMLGVLHASQSTFRTGWFVESLATQTLVIYVIRTRRTPFLRSRPSLPMLVIPTSCALVGALITFTPLAGVLGFTRLPPLFFLILVGMVVTYLGLVELVKTAFYAVHPLAFVKLPTTSVQRLQRRILRRAGHFVHHGPRGVQA